MKLGELARSLAGSVLQGDPQIDVSDVTYDSRRVVAGSLFVAIQGQHADGHQFIDAARKKGAVAVVSEQSPVSNEPWIQVSDARVALAEFSAGVLDHPSRALTLVGVTGTNGKTTTAYLIDAALRECGHTVGLLGTVKYRIGQRMLEATRTTPESSDLQSLFREMVDQGCTHAVLEVSSHSLELQRVHGCRFQVSVFTNLTRDHLDFHGDMDAYFAAKRKLFSDLTPEKGISVLNADDDRCEELRQSTRSRVITYALERPADVRAQNIRLSLEGTSFTVRTSRGDFEVHSPLLGRFNVANLLAALSASFALNLDLPCAIRGLTSLSGVPGRLERVEFGQGFSVIVDYAHTDDALKNLLETVRELAPRRVITVFGCGGDRDPSKRPLMGAVASRLSDVVIVTSDNPRSEAPESIVTEIERGMNGSRKAERHIIIDRRDAIAHAFMIAESGDCVVIAGKGHETYQVLRDRTIPFDDRQVARDLLSASMRKSSA